MERGHRCTRTGEMKKQRRTAPAVAVTEPNAMEHFHAKHPRHERNQNPSPFH